MAITVLERGSSNPRAIVSITLASGNFKFLSGEHASIIHDPIVESIGDIGQTLDIKTRKVTYGSTDVRFMDDGTIRGLIASETFKNQKIEIFAGNDVIVEGSFVKVFGGIITDVKPFEGGIVINADDNRGRIFDSDIRARDFTNTITDMIINRHPLQIILAILQELLPASDIDTASFDPDTYDTGSRAISHWNTARAIHGDLDRRIVDQT